MGVGPRISSSSLHRADYLKYDDQGYISSCSAADGARRAAARARGPHGILPQPQPPNPNPMRWSILRSEKVDGFLIVMAHYPDATSYEGVKILVFAPGVTVANLKDQGMLDPHFCKDSEFVHPIARFAPTENGWDFAKAACENYVWKAGV